MGEDDGEEISSGKDDDSREVGRLLGQRGVPMASRLDVTTHVEMKVAARMIRAEVPHAEIVINQVVCAGRLGCARLPVLLPAGYSITVHGPGYTQTFEGAWK